MFRQISIEISNISFHGNPSGVGPVIQDGRTDRHIDRQTEMTKRKMAFCNCFVNAPNKECMKIRET